jgi:hypothetical protein
MSDSARLKAHRSPSVAHGYGNPPPQTVLVLGEHGDFAELNFASCELAGRLTNRYGIENSAIDG